ncbi:hypothetical protein KCP71_01685 [Salmonella enterica subsp. enterica]|nr:hypothetical protein KCP71_01685 [Salmonella enterica subsp. enterica]
MIRTVIRATYRRKAIPENPPAQQRFHHTIIDMTTTPVGDVLSMTLLTT